MKSCRREAFTLVELAIGILLLLIISGPVVMTLRSGIELYMKTEANAQVTNGVRFTLDSFGRRISPMLNETCDIKILQDPVIPDPVPKYMNYVYLYDGAVVHKDSSGDHALEGSEHISALNFTVPSSAAESPDNFILGMSATGAYKTAKLDVSVKETLYNKPVKDGNLVSGAYMGNVLVFKTPGVQEVSISLDLYDNATKIKINNSNMPKGTVILASYDLNITRNRIEIPYTDESSLDWYISGTAVAPLVISKDDPTGNETAKNSNQYLLVDEYNQPITTKTLSTSGDFYIRTGTDTRTKWGEYGVIRCRLTPSATTYNGSKVTDDPVWSGYVEIKNKTFWQTWLDAIGGTPTDGFYNSNIGLDQKVSLDIVGNEEILELGITHANKIKATTGSFTLARLDYKFMDNDRLYSIWENRKDKTAIADDIPAFITVTNYSILIDLKMNKVVLFGLTLSDTPNSDTVANGVPFNDLGYSVYLCDQAGLGQHATSKVGIFVHPHDGSSTKNMDNDPFEIKGVQNLYIDKPATEGDCYHPTHIQNNVFTAGSTDWWEGYHRILYTVLEYYDKNDANRLPKYIIRVRFLKLKGEVSEDLKADPWCIGPRYFASEPMWFGEFVGNTVSTANSVGNNIDATATVRHYASSLESSTVKVLLAGLESVKHAFYGLKSSISPAIQRIFKGQILDMASDTTLTDAKQRLKIANRDRYIGMQVYTDKVNETMDIYNIDIVPGFTANEIRSIIPANMKLYEINDTIPLLRLPSTSPDSGWYSSNLDAAIYTRNFNDKVFQKNTDTGESIFFSNGIGNHSIYNTEGVGVIGIQHVPASCTCPLENELFKWLAK